jgi:hypothetical protein
MSSTQSTANVVAYSQCVEAESGSGNRGPQADGGASGGQSVAGFGNNAEYMEYTLTNIPATGDYTLRLLYVTGESQAGFGLVVNGTVLPTVIKPGVGRWSAPYQDATTTVTLNAGTNTLRMRGSGQGVFVLDKLCVEGSTTTTPPVANVDYKGFLDNGGCDYVEGWALDYNRSQQSVSVDIYINGTKAATVPANNTRPDVRDYYGIVGYSQYGFKWFLPNEYKTGSPLTISVKFAGTGTELAASPKTTAACAGTAPPVASTNYQGYLDFGDCTHMQGWALDLNRSQQSNSVDIYINGLKAVTVLANDSRTDVRDYFGLTGYSQYGFDWPLPNSYKNGSALTISVKYAGTNTEIGASPKITTACPGTGTPPTSSLAISPSDNQNVGPQSGTLAFGVTASNVTWTANSSSPSWLTVSPTTGSASESVRVTYLTNPVSSSRSATVSFSGSGGVGTKTVTVTQAGATPPPSTANPFLTKRWAGVVVQSINEGNFAQQKAMVKASWENGANYIMLVYEWDVIESPQYANAGYTYHDQIANYAASLDLRIVPKIVTLRERANLAGFYTLNQLSVDNRGDQSFDGGNRSAFSLWDDAALTSAKEFVQRVKNHILSEPYSNKVLAAGVVNNESYEWGHGLANRNQNVNSGEPTLAVFGYEPGTLAKFRAWLVSKYGSLSAINTACGTSFGTVDLIKPGNSTSGGDGTYAFAGSLGLHWGTFRNQQLKVAYNKVTEPLVGTWPVYMDVSSVEGPSAKYNGTTDVETLGAGLALLKSNGAPAHDTQTGNPIPLSDASPAGYWEFPNDQILSHVPASGNELDYGQQQRGWFPLGHLEDQIKRQFTRGCSMVNFFGMDNIEEMITVMRNVDLPALLAVSPTRIARNTTIGMLLSKAMREQPNQSVFNAAGGATNWIQINIDRTGVPAY